MSRGGARTGSSVSQLLFAPQPLCMHPPFPPKSSLVRSSLRITRSAFHILRATRYILVVLALSTTDRMLNLSLIAFELGCFFLLTAPFRVRAQVPVRGVRRQGARAGAPTLDPAQRQRRADGDDRHGLREVWAGKEAADEGAGSGGGAGRVSQRSVFGYLKVFCTDI